jgi:hypothetical protein
MAIMESKPSETCIGCGATHTVWNDVHLCPDCEKFLTEFNTFYLYYFLEQEDLIARVREMERAHPGYHNRIRLNTNKHIRACNEAHVAAKKEELSEMFKTFTGETFS